MASGYGREESRLSRACGQRSQSRISRRENERRVRGAGVFGCWSKLRRFQDRGPREKKGKKKGGMAGAREPGRRPPRFDKTRLNPACETIRESVKQSSVMLDHVRTYARACIRTNDHLRVWIIVTAKTADRFAAKPSILQSKVRLMINKES